MYQLIIATIKLASCHEKWPKNWLDTDIEVQHNHSLSNGWEKERHTRLDTTREKKQGRQWVRSVMHVWCMTPLFIVAQPIRVFSARTLMILENIWIETHKKSSTYDSGSYVTDRCASKQLSVVHANMFPPFCLSPPTLFFCHSIFWLYSMHLDNCLLVGHSCVCAHHSWRSESKTTPIASFNKQQKEQVFNKLLE